VGACMHACMRRRGESADLFPQPNSCRVDTSDSLTVSLEGLDQDGVVRLVAYRMQSIYAGIKLL